ncbi:MAG: His/Gly/Thr/Pro-type tRNA ligase C-terminal domain-containing protein, partial [Alphaproteobacteria bacterium]
IYATLLQHGIEVLYDDRAESPGVKFADMDLIGLPWQIVVGPRGLKTGLVELKDRHSGVRQELSLESLFAKLPAEVVSGPGLALLPG